MSFKWLAFYLVAAFSPVIATWTPALESNLSAGQYTVRKLWLLLAQINAYRKHGIVCPVATIKLLSFRTENFSPSIIYKRSCWRETAKTAFKKTSLKDSCSFYSAQFICARISYEDMLKKQFLTLKPSDCYELHTLGRKIFLHNVKFSQFSHMLQSTRKRAAIYLIFKDPSAFLSQMRGINGSQSGAFRKVYLFIFVSSH